MSDSSRRLSRGDRRRNDRLVRLRAVVTRQTAVLAFDLAADKQVCALADQDSRVLARRTVTAKAWQLAEAVQWGLAQAAAAGFSSVVVACEPTGHRWRVLDQIAEQAGVRLVCVQPLLVHRARESEDFTRNKSDETDAIIIARLSAVGAAAILAETGDPTRFTSARALVKHAGLCPRDNASGSYQGKTGISGRGRPQLDARPGLGSVGPRPLTWCRSPMCRATGRRYAPPCAGTRTVLWSACRPSPVPRR
jgi:hypothetical protein